MKAFCVLFISILLSAASASAEIKQIKAFSSGSWQGGCVPVLCYASVNGDRRTKMGILSIKPSLSFNYKAEKRRFVLEFTAMHPPNGFKYDVSKSYLLVSGKRISFAKQEHAFGGKGRLTSSLYREYEISDREVKEIIGYLAKENFATIIVSYKLNGKRYTDSIRLSLRGSSKTLSTVYAQFDENGRTFEPAAISKNRSASNSSGGYDALSLLAAGLVAYGNLVSNYCQNGTCDSASSSPAGSSSTHSFSCRIPCTGSTSGSVSGFGNVDARISVTINASSASAAKSYANSNHGRLCREAGYKQVPQPIFCD